MRLLLIVVVQLKVVEVLSNKMWAQTYVTNQSTRRTKKVSTHLFYLRNLA